MWASQLRDYRQQADKKTARIPSRRGPTASGGGLQGCPSDSDSQVATGYSLYSSGDDMTAKTTKNLDRCANLLTVMMNREPAKAANDQKSPKVVASKVKKAKGGKPSVVRSRKQSDKVSQTGMVRKVAAKSGHGTKNKENAIDSVSETSTDLQIRLAGPAPLPLNNSETVIQIVGKEPEKIPKTRPGSAVLTSVPYNDRILSSTPMGSPSSKTKDPLTKPGYAVYPVSVTAVPAQNPQTSYRYATVTGQPTQMNPHVADGHAVDNQGNPGLARPTKFYPPVQRPNSQWTSDATGLDTGTLLQQPLSHNSSPLTNLTEMEDQQLGSLLRNFLSQGQSSQGILKNQGTFQGMSHGQGQTEGHLDFSGRSQQPEKGPSTTHVAMPTDSALKYGVSGLPQTGLPQTTQAKVAMETPSYKLPPQTSGIDVDAILQSHGIETSVGQSQGQTYQPTPNQYSAGITQTAPPTAQYPATGAPDVIEGVKLSAPPYRIGIGTDDTDEPPTKETGLPEPPLSSYPLPDDNEDDTVLEIPGDSEPLGAAKEADDQKKVKRTPNNMKKKKDRRISALKGTPLNNKKSPADTKSQVRTLQYLFGELRSVANMSGDREIKRLLTDMEKVLVSLTPGLSSSTLSTEIDLAMQPLRSENAQLRRRIRILTQQFKETIKATEDASKPDPTFQSIHLELQRQTLETQLQEEIETREKLHVAIATLTQQNQGLMAERQKMIQLLAAKDSDHLKSQQDWVGESSSLRAQLQVSKQEVEELEKSLAEVNHDAKLLQVNVRQKDKEIDRLQNLVKSLQESMSRLLNDLKGNKPRPLGTLEDIGEYLRNMDSLLQTNRPSQMLLEVRPMREEAAPLTQQPPMTRPVHQYTDDTPCYVRDGLQRAQQLLTRLDTALSPPGGASQHQSTPEQVRESQQDGVLTSPARRTTRKTDSSLGSSPGHGYKDTRPSRPHHLEADFEDYTRRLTQELLEEHDRQNGIDPGAIERMLEKNDQYLGKCPAYKPSTENIDSYTPSYKYTAEVIEEMLGGKVKPQNLVGTLSEESHTDVQQKRPSNVEKPQRTLSGSMDQDLDTTQYLSPPGKVTGQGQGKVRSNKVQVPSGPTVKELLAPFADRIMRSPGKNLGGPFKQLSPASSNVTTDTLTSESTEPGGEGDLEGDSTLVEDTEVKGEGQEEAVEPSVDDESRYSVTDYFKKYPILGSTTQPKSTAAVEPSEHRKPQGSRNDAVGNIPLTQESPAKTDKAEDSSQARDQSTGSVQGRLYQGTELDTSLSTIQEAETTSILSGSTVTSVSSLASVDEFVFRDGLAKLDENIARIQESLKHQKATGWK